VAGSRSLILIALGAAAVAARHPAQAQKTGQWALCGGPLTPPVSGDPAKRESPDTPVTVDSDSARLDEKRQRYTFTGNAALTRADQQLSADELQYDRPSGDVAAAGDVRYLEKGVELNADRGHYNLNSQSGTLSSGDYRIDAGHLHGEADEMVLVDPLHSRYRNVTLTTCNPGEEVWWLHASSLEINREERYGEAWNTWVSFEGVPLLYSPWLRFPVGSDRMTGFLAPVFGHSQDGGVEFGIPFYLNLAPNYDATITPRYFTRRGTMLGTQFRYLEPWVRGRVDLTYLPDDRAYGADRWSIDQAHELRVGDHLRGELRQQRVSDTSYLGDFSENFDVISERNLESRAAVAWSSADWSLSADAQSWQTVDPDIPKIGRPYAHKPRVQFRFDPLGYSWLDYGVDGEATHFYHPDPSERVTGNRVDLTPRIAFPYKTLGYHITPGVKWRYTSYDLERPDPAAPATPTRSVPIYSVDAGLALERDTNLFGRDMVQTLEPQLYYLYVPTRDQSDLPLFDTGNASLTYAQLFSDNRFTGTDRVGDANQLATGVTSRLIDRQSGVEYLRLSAGQIFYFKDRTVTLGGAPETAPRSNYVGELRAQLGGGLSTSINGQLDPENTGNQQWNGTLQWRDGARRAANLRYRTARRDGAKVYETGEINFALPVSMHWSVFGGWRYDWVNARTQQRFEGLQYEGCCYAVRLAQRSYLSTGSGGAAKLSGQVLLELELKGLGGVGDRLTSFFEDAVSGYKAPQY